jgi:hypothetical protein
MSLHRARGAVIGIALVVVAVTQSSVAAQPLIQGFFENPAIEEDAACTLHVTVRNPGAEVLTITELRVLAGPFVIVGDNARGPLALRKNETATFSFELRSPHGTREVVLGALARWQGPASAGSLAVPIATVRVTKSLRSELIEVAWKSLGVAALLALLSLAGNAYLNWIKNQWDAKRQDQVRREDVLRRVGEQVHALVQKHYSRIASWAGSFDEEATPHAGTGTPPAALAPPRGEYLTYLLARYLRLESDMEDDSGGYFLRDMRAEVVQGFLYAGVARHITRPGPLSDEQYSYFVQQLGSRETFVEFRQFVRSDSTAAVIGKELQTLFGDPRRLEALIHLMRLKWKLLEFHINRIRADWYPVAIRGALDSTDLGALDAVLAEIVQDGALTQKEAAGYGGVVRQNAS